MWHAIYTAHSKEMAVAAYIAKAGIDAVCPVATETVRRRIKGTHSYAIKQVVGPIFRHYIFAKAVPELYTLLIRTPENLGTIRILKSGEGYGELKDELVEPLRHIGEVLVHKDLAHLKLGSHVILPSFSGMVASIVKVADLLSCQEISVRFKMLGRWKELTVPALSVEPV